MKVLSLFDGISCARVALGRAGIPVEVYIASEVDKYAIQVSQKNYPDIIQRGDIKNLQIATNPDGNNPVVPTSWSSGVEGIDLLIGGSPCQDLSIAKKNRKGLDGERSGLFWEYVRILKEVKPKYFILENVNSMPKEAKQIITETLGVEPIMINASLVSAQNRKRLFWTNIPNITQPEDKGILLKDILETEVESKYYLNQETLERAIANRKAKMFHTGNGRGQMSLDRLELGKALTLTTNSGSGENRANNLVRVGGIGKEGQGDRIYSPEGKSVGLSALGGGRGAKTGLYKVSGVASRTFPRIPNGEPRIKQIEIRDDEKSNSMTLAQEDSMVMESRVRKLTPIECERLQGLPDNYTEGVSNTQRYKMLGNAFNVDVVAHILSFIPR